MASKARGMRTPPKRKRVVSYSRPTLGGRKPPKIRTGGTGKRGR